MRFIGGQLVIDADGTLQVVGHLDGDGYFEWSGAWKFDSSDGEIAGDVTVTGDFDLTGKLSAGDVLIEGGKIHVANMVIDPNDDGGSVRFPGGAKMTAHSGTAGVRVDSGSG